MSLTINSIRKEFEGSTNQEQQDVAGAYEFSVQKAKSAIARIESTGNRTFRGSDSLEELRRLGRGDRIDQTLLGFQEFSSSLRATGVKPYEAAFGGELIARQMAGLIDLSRKDTLSALEQARTSVLDNLIRAQRRVQGIMSRNVTSAVDNFEGIQNSSASIDPLRQTSQYIFYDAFAVVRGPQTVKIVDFNNDIMSANVNISTDISPGSFSIMFANDMEQYVDDYGVYAFKTGDTVRIYATKRFDDGEDRYVHVFWGILERVAENYSEGQSTITLSGQDITAWLQYTTVRPNPTLLEVVMNPGLQPAKYGHKYAGKNVIEVITDVILNEVGDFNTAEGYDSRQLKERGDAAAILQEINNTAPGSPERANALQKYQRQTEGEGNSKKSIIQWWRDLFHDELVLKIFGYDGIVNVTTSNNVNSVVQQKGVLLEHDQLTPDQRREVQRHLVLNAQSQCYVAEILDKYVPLRVMGEVPLAGTIELEDTPKIEVIRAVTEGTMFEFFMDSDGALVFKPPFYNEYPANNESPRYSKLFQDVDCGNKNPFDSGDDEKFDRNSAFQYIINEEDVISFDISEDSTAIVTRQEVTGEPRDMELPQEMLWGGAQNNDLMKRYGLRVGSPKKQRMLEDLNDLNTFAKSLMDYQNTKFYTGTITIIGRPELRLGRTIYVVSRNTIFYITALSHSFTAGGSFTTTLTLVAGRRMFLGADGTPIPNLFDGEQFLETDLEQQKREFDQLATEDYAATEDGASDLAERKKRISDLETKKSIYSSIRENKGISEEQLKALGFLPRRISDSNGRRIYGTLPYGLFAAPPPPPQTNDKTGRGGTQESRGANPSGESRPGGSTVPASAGNLAAAAGTITTGTEAETRQRQQDMRGAGAPLRTNLTGQPSVIETTKNCAESRDKKSFNPSNLVGLRRVNGLNL